MPVVCAGRGRWRSGSQQSTAKSRVVGEPNDESRVVGEPIVIQDRQIRFLETIAESRVVGEPIAESRVVGEQSLNHE